MSDETPEDVEELAAERRPAAQGPTARPAITSQRLRTAWVVAMVADFVQIVAFPLFFWGAASPANTVLDGVVALILTRLLGWHWAFLPTVAAELVPIVDLVPTWTLAVFLVGRGRK